MTGSISFDRAAEFYDETRALPPDIAGAITEAVLDELAAAGTHRLLEVGAGTGRIAYPLVKRRVHVTAVDISLPMLRKFREKVQPGDTAPGFLLADATLLPFVDARIPAIMTVHVLHLIFDWRRAIDEFRRVLAPGGVILREGARDDFEEIAEHRASKEAYEGILARRGFVPRKRAEIDDTNDYVRETGGTVRSVPLGEVVDMRSEAKFIKALKGRIHSNLWEIPDDAYKPFVTEYEAWARAELGDLTVERPVTYTYVLDIWTWPG